MTGVAIMLPSRRAKLACAMPGGIRTLSRGHPMMLNMSKMLKTLPTPAKNILELVEMLESTSSLRKGFRCSESETSTTKLGSHFVPVWHWKYSSA